MSDQSQGSPRVSVLMPTYRQAPFIRRALESLRAQTLAEWELIIVDDGSPDATGDVVAPYLADARISYRRLERNGGLGAALNIATSAARGQYLAYLPSDDLYYPEHLRLLASWLDAHPDDTLAYGGLRWGYQRYGPTLQGEAAVGREAEALADPPPPTQEAALTSGNILALVQVMHRRPAGETRWATRDEVVSDTLEADFWRALLARGARFAYIGAVTCEWVDHPEQRHKIIAGPRNSGGLARYRGHYGVGRGEWLRWRPSRGVRVDERARYGQLDARRALPEPGGLTILLAGSLGFNPERVLALEERGHKLHGLWLPHPETWDAAGPFPFGNIDDVPYDRAWPERVRALKPDIIYALLNWQSLGLVEEVLDARIDAPLVFHFKESPFIAQERGLWPALVRALTESDGQIFINEECFDWFQLALDGALDPEAALLLDGDRPKIDWMTDAFSPRLSERDGQIHTVCPGRPLGLDPFDVIARAGIHVHFYGEHFHQWFPNWTRSGLATGYMHLHPAVEPADWVRELSQYDAAWFHVFESFNEGDMRRAHWDDLNLPARLGTYAAAGLPWIIKENRRSRVALQRLAQQHDVGLLFRDFADLAEQLRDGARLGRLTENMRVARHAFAFDAHADELISFFRRVIERGRRKAGSRSNHT